MKLVEVTLDHNLPVPQWWLSICTNRLQQAPPLPKPKGTFPIPSILCPVFLQMRQPYLFISFFFVLIMHYVHKRGDVNVIVRALNNLCFFLKIKPFSSSSLLLRVWVCLQVLPFHQKDENWKKIASHWLSPSRILQGLEICFQGIEFIRQISRKNQMIKEKFCKNNK